MDRDLSREQLRAIVRAGLQQTRGSYRLLVTLFNMPAHDYKRFLGFLRKHGCQVPFQPFRTIGPREADSAAPIGIRDGAAVAHERSRLHAVV